MIESLFAVLSRRTCGWCRVARDPSDTWWERTFTSRTPRILYRRSWWLRYRVWSARLGLWAHARHLEQATPAT